VKLPSASVIRKELFEWLRYGALGACVYVLASHWVHHASGPKEGSPAAAFDLPLIGEAGRASLAAQHGKPLLVEFVASWCSACKRSSPRLVELWRSHQHDNVTFLAISVDDDPAAASRLKSEWQIPFAVAQDDGSASRNYGVSMLPTLVYIDQTGTVRHASAGVTSRSDLEDWLTNP